MPRGLEHIEKASWNCPKEGYMEVIHVVWRIRDCFGRGSSEGAQTERWAALVVLGRGRRWRSIEMFFVSRYGHNRLAYSHLSAGIYVCGVSLPCCYRVVVSWRIRLNGSGFMRDTHKGSCCCCCVELLWHTDGDVGQSFVVGFQM